jgi:histidine phosphotransfer protein HptB
MTQLSNETAPLYSSLGGDPDLGEIVGLFVEEMPARIAALLDLLGARDWEGLRRLAHQLKGSAGSYGFDPISPCAGAVENAIRNGEPEESICEALDVLIDLCNRVRPGAPA